MSTNPALVAIPGSERVPLAHAKAVGAPAPDERFEVTVRIRPRPATARAAVASDPLGATVPRARHYQSREEFAAQQGADPADLAKVEAFARTHGLAVVEASAARRSVVLSGTVAAFSAAFGVTLSRYEYPGGSYRGRTGSVHVPAEVAGVIEAVLGLDDRPIAKPHFQRQPAPEGVMARTAGKSFTPPELARLYNFPTGVSGEGQCIAIIELGGGYRTADITSYFEMLGLPVPRVTAILVDHAHNHPTGPDGPDGEVMLDIEVAAAVAPKAHIAVYFAPNTDQGFLDAITRAIHDSINKPSVISISWGSAESNWTPQAMQQYDAAFQNAAALGVTICCAAGDSGSDDGVGDGRAHVDFPASSPHVLGCGGTKLVASQSRITSEVVWNEGPTSATGGGISDFFDLPVWQKHARVPPSVNPGGRVGRGVPDVAGDADPATGYRVRVDGQDLVIGGTSAVAPLWAGLIALLNQRLRHPVGYLNPLAYGPAASAFRSVATGSNGHYKACDGWDPCTGLGTPDGVKLLTALGAA